MKINDRERRLWCENNEYLYLLRKLKKLSLVAFVRQYKAEIDRVIKKELGE